jgi:hypothetical protein
VYSDAVANYVTSSLGRWPYAILAMALSFGVPFLFAWIFVRLIDRPAGRGWARHSLDGLLLGLGAAAWASACWLTVPYMGGYPSLGGLAFASAVSGFDPPIDTLREELAVHLGNILLLPPIVWFFVQGLRSGTPREPVASPR